VVYSVICAWTRRLSFVGSCACRVTHCCSNSRHRTLESSEALLLQPDLNQCISIFENKLYLHTDQRHCSAELFHYKAIRCSPCYVVFELSSRVLLQTKQYLMHKLKMSYKPTDSHHLQSPCLSI